MLNFQKLRDDRWMQQDKVVLLWQGLHELSSTKLQFNWNKFFNIYFRLMLVHLLCLFDTLRRFAWLKIHNFKMLSRLTSGLFMQ